MDIGGIGRNILFIVIKSKIQAISVNCFTFFVENYIFCFGHIGRHFISSLPGCYLVEFNINLVKTSGKLDPDLCKGRSIIGKEEGKSLMNIRNRVGPSKLP